MPNLFIFRRDLRLQDNTGLIESLKEAYKNNDYVIPIFIFDDRQIKNNEYFSEKAFLFMLNSLIRLNNELKKFNSKLYCFKGIAHELIEKIIKTKNIENKVEKIKAVYLNKDYTPFSIKRDLLIKEVCEKNNVNFYSYSDVLLNEPNTLKNYSVFTPFFKAYSKLYVKKPIDKPIDNNLKNFFPIKKEKDYFNQISNNFINEFIELEEFIEKNNYKNKLNSLKIETDPDLILQKIEKLDNYESIRNYPFKETSFLSAHLKFGTISVRQAYYKISEKFTNFHPLIRQLYWRDFFYHIAYNYPYVFGNSFQKKYENLKWEFDESNLNAWKNGLTGFPIVDAGMRQLNETGYMHNRVRMIVASFLTKDLHIDWKLGEKYFAQKLIDYDPCLNNGNWQWASSTGCDPQPYFRIFNPWLQQKKFDPNAEYIKKWIPELKDLPPFSIHNLETINIKNEKNINYPEPIVNHKEESKKAIEYFKKLT